MNKALLDSSAITALVKKEPGADKVSAVLPHALMSSVNVMEAVRVLQRFNFTYAEATENMSFLLGEVVLFDREQSYKAARLESIARRYGLSLGDCVCLSLAQELNIKVLTSDTAWLPAAPELNISVKLIR